MESEQKFTGFLLIKKQAGVTSFDCIKKIKRLVPKKERVGHAGTLDSFATGLLIVAIGRAATRIMNHMIKLDKQYVARAKLGQLTDTLDFTGITLQESDASGITAQQVQSVIDSFGSSYLQKPPVFSALKHEGSRISDLARRGKLDAVALETVAQSKAREVMLYRLELIDCDLPFFTIDAHVSHGTYIRSLVDDIAQRLEAHATTYALERKNIGPFSVDNAVEVAQLTSMDDIEQYAISVETVEESLREYASDQIGQ